MKKEYLISGCGYTVTIPTKKELNGFNILVNSVMKTNTIKDNAMLYAVTKLLCGKLNYKFESHL
jgi:hypothetical protein